jgi:hypothetical protein
LSAQCLCCFFVLSFSFDSVDDFLRKASEAKAQQREGFEGWADDLLSDKQTVGVPIDMADAIGDLVKSYGDEALRQIALFALGKWYAIHTGVIQEMVVNEDNCGTVAAAMDAARISSAVQLIEGLGSFGGDDHWRDMLKETLLSEVDELNAKNDNWEN